MLRRTRIVVLMPRLLRTVSTPKMNVANGDAGCVMPLNLTAVVGTHVKVGTVFGRQLLVELTGRPVYLHACGADREFQEQVARHAFDVALRFDEDGVAMAGSQGFWRCFRFISSVGSSLGITIIVSISY